jgi:hypothetical protein
MAVFDSDFAPWLQQDASSLYLNEGYTPDSMGSMDFGGPSVFTADQKEAIRESILETLALANGSTLASQLAYAENYAATNQLSMIYADSDGTIYVLQRIEDNGQPTYIITHDLAQAQTMSVQTVWTNGSTGLNLDGESTFIGMFDVGDVLATHQEFGSRVSNYDSSLAQQGHSMHVMGVLASAGVNSKAKGMSPQCPATAYNAVLDTALMPQVATTNQSLLSNHSYGHNVGWGGQEFVLITTGGGTIIANGYYPVWNGNPSVSKTVDYNFGLYSSDSVNVDTIVYNARTYLPVWSAGNERGPQGLPNGVAGGASSGFYCFGYSGTYGHFVAPGDPNFSPPPADGSTTGGFTTLSSYQCAKDNLVIGSITNITGGYQGSNSVKLSTFSSLGPTTDGRIKPDLVAPGENIFFPDTNGNSSYFTDSGTSFSSPSVAGALNLVVEQNRRQNGTNAQLLASTLKGLAIHTADPAGTNAGPNYGFGWGMFDARNAATLFAGNAFTNGLPFIKEILLFDGDYILFPVSVTNGTPQLKVTICWTDPPAQAGPAALDPTNLFLINDLDLRVISPNGTTNFPWVLNPASPAAAATTGDNVRDNVEQVIVHSPAAGTYLVKVTHKGHIVDASGQDSAQWVSVLASGLQPHLMQPPAISESLAVPGNQSFALKWNSTPGLSYQVLQTTNLVSPNWQAASDVISATKTNTAFVVPMSALGNQFFRILGSRP